MRYVDKRTFDKTAGLAGDVFSRVSTFFDKPKVIKTSDDILRKVVEENPGYIINPDILQETKNAISKRYIETASAELAKNSVNKPPKLSQNLGKILWNLATGLSIGGGITGVAALLEKYQVRKQAVQSPLMFQDMLMKNGDVNTTYLESDEGKARVEDLYKLLEKMAPNVAANPLAAGTFIRQYMMYGDLALHVDAIDSLTRINNNMSQKSPSYSGNSLTSLLNSSIAGAFKSGKD